MSALPTAGIPRYRVGLLPDGESPGPCTPVTNPTEAATVLAPWFRGADREQLVVLGLDAKFRPLGTHLASLGHLTGSHTKPREVFKALILMNAYAWIVAHNHPSGDLEPSEEDIELTEHLSKASALIEIPLVDHLIFGPDGSARSLDDTGQLRLFDPAEVQAACPTTDHYPHRRSTHHDGHPE